MNKELDHLFLGTVSLLMYLINRFCIKPGIMQSTELWAIILKNHFNDFCGSFLFCAYFNILINKINKDLHFDTLKEYLAVGVLCSAFWEFFSPAFLKKSVSDLKDCLAYMLGVIAYYLSLRALQKVRNKYEL